MQSAAHLSRLLATKCLNVGCTLMILTPPPPPKKVATFLRPVKVRPVEFSINISYVVIYLISVFKFSKLAKHLTSF